jgi:fructokinase
VTAPPGADPAVVVAGDALIDLTPTTTVRGTSAYEPHPGGSCLNVAVGLARLEVPTAFLARVSSDAFGQLLRGHLAASGVLPTYLIDTDDLTTLAAVHLRDGQATYSFHAAGAADRGLQPEHLAALPPGAALHLGSIALVLEPVASTLEGLLRREAGRRTVSLDPNVRPGLIPDRKAYLRRFVGWVPSVDVLKVSQEDLAWLYPGRPEDEVVASWLAAGVSLVVVTHGGHGARASTPLASASAAAPRVAVVDTVGAGDAFMAGALAYLHERRLLAHGALRALNASRLTELLQAACLVAAATCTRAGADPPRRRHLDAQVARAPRDVTVGIADLVERARALAVPGRRQLLGITGPPGAAKDRVATALVAALGPETAVLVPVEGFHLSNATLRALGRRNRKGAWDTFDTDGYLHLLRRLRSREDAVVYAPDFDRNRDQAIGSVRPVPRAVPLVVTEGDFLLLDRGRWREVRDLLDQTWYVDAPQEVRLGTDQADTDLTASTHPRADLVVRLLD